MARSIIKELQNSKNLQFVIDETKARFSSIFWPSLLTPTYTDNLRWDTVIGERKSGVAGNVTAFDVSKPLHTRDALREKGGKIPSIRGKRKMKETDFLKYIALQRQNNPNKQRVLDLIYDDIAFCSTAGHHRADWMIARLLSQGGKLAFTNADNVGAVTVYNVDFEVPTANKKGVSVVWSDTENSKPLLDLKNNIFKPMATNGLTGGVLRMHPNQIFELLESKSVITKFGLLSKGSVDSIDLSLDTVNRYLQRNGWPIIKPFNASIGVEIDGKVTFSNPWRENIVTWTPDGPVGQLHQAPIVDLEVEDPGLSVATYLGAAVTRWYQEDPKVEFTGYELNAFPSLDIADQMLTFNTNSVTNWADPS